MTRLRIATFVALCLAVVCSAAPAPVPDPSPAIDNTQEIIEIIAPAQAAQETLETLSLGEPNSEQSERNKRTIGILRQLFPNLSQIVDRKIQGIVSFLIRTVGRTVLSSALGGGGGGAGGAGGAGGNDGGKVSVALPTYSPDEDSDEDEDDSDVKPSAAAMVANRFGDDDSSPSASSSSSSTTVANKDDASTSATTTTTTVPLTSAEGSATSTSTTTVTTVTTITDRIITESVVNTTSSTSTVSSSATAAVNGDDENSLSEAESQHSEVRVQFTDNEDEKKSDEAADSSSSQDQESAASGGNNGALDDLSLDDADASDENRNKRSGFLNFGLGGGDSQASSSGGSGGGSGNFLFDIIRRPAESAARAAGQMFRILTGTDSIGLGITATHTAVRDAPTYADTLNNASRLLVAGSGATEQSDEAASAPADGDVAKGDGYTEGIPGPVTRLFIIANRGIANLIQDLILRIAQTSERIVNFKARLITSII